MSQTIRTGTPHDLHLEVPDFPSEQEQILRTLALFPSCPHHQMNANAVVYTP